MPLGAAIGSIAGALISKSASDRAANVQAKAADKATAARTAAFETTREDLAPFAGVGKSAAYTLADFYGLDRGGGGPTGEAYNAKSLDAFRQSPDYQYALSEGQRGINAARASSGRLDSGKTLKALTSYSSNLASSNLGSYLQRLYSLAGLGSGAAGQSAAAAGNLGSGLASDALGRGEATASGIVGGANAINRGIGDATNNLAYYRFNSGASSYAGNSLPSIPWSYGDFDY